MWAGLGVRALIDLAGQIDTRNQLRTVLRIANLQKLLPDLTQQHVGLSGIDNALTLASAHIQIESVNPQPVSPRAAPIHIGKGLARIPTGAGFPSDVAIVQQPSIEIEGAPVGSKSMVRKDEQRRIVIDRKSTRLNSSHQIISYPVFSFNQQQQ